MSDEVVVDLLASACGVTCRDALEAGSDHREIDGVVVPRASPETLVRTKRTCRPSDRADIAYLERLIDAERRPSP